MDHGDDGERSSNDVIERTDHGDGGGDTDRVPVSIAPELADQPASPANLQRLRAAGLPEAAYDRAVEIALQSPPAEAWLRFVERASLGLGIALVLAAVIYFFAFNWARLGPFAQFILIQAGIVSAIAIAWKLGLERLEGQIAVTAGAVLTGVLLAVIGQTYQTGADRWTMFAAWALLALPWAFAARFTPLWLVELVLANVALALWLTTQTWLTGAEPLITALLVVFAFNAFGLLAWEFLGPAGNRWMPRIMLTVALVALTGANITWILGDTVSGQESTLSWSQWVATALGIGAIAVIPVLYGRWQPDLYMEAALAAAVIAVVTTVLGRLFLLEMELFAVGFLLLGLAVLGQAAVAAAWLRGEARRGSDEVPSW